MKSISKLYQIKLLNPAILLIRFWLGTVMLHHSGTFLFQEKVTEQAVFLESLNWPIPLVLAYASQIEPNTRLITFIHPFVLQLIQNQYD
ncbi:hypothetical protein SAMN03080598_02560 [Algoriphagus boritolerans DSM 17298 = JCM 18970]|uniref:Uncharacterized protein n=1 Tax=Algoriphagus boritolerans DSM 17298 = JCM 18970 TaxID=1120964 RepID=A0A1H5XLP3_9BACT|nr:hypothetical protein SAMN03080598_02560 [Algoriphagus boritolerans DSM 17298 = JCM 18970]